MTDDKIVKEILDKCNRKGIKVHYILKVNNDFYKKEMDYFIAPAIESESEINFGCLKGFGYKINSILKRLKKTSIGSGLFSNSHKDEFSEVYFDWHLDKEVKIKKRAKININIRK